MAGSTFVAGTDDRPLPELPAGARIGRITIVRALGHGGSGTVYEGIDEGLDRRVAVKALHPHAAGPAARARLLREARVLSRLDDGRITRIYDLLEVDDRLYLVLELVRGQTLRDILKHDPDRLNRRLCLDIAEQLSAMLAHTHAAGVVHRDLKPSNVMLTEDGAVKVLDFGVAFRRDDEALAWGDGRSPSGAPVSGAQSRANPEEGDAAVPGSADSSTSRTTHRSFASSAARDDHSIMYREPTRPGESVVKVFGTIAYMSPEQACGDQPTPASDLYALGLLLQEIFTRRWPHPDGLSRKELLVRASLAQSDPVRGLEAPITRLINSLKAALPEDRPTAERALRIIRAIRNRPRRRLRIGAAAAAAVVAAFLVVNHYVTVREERNLAVAARAEALAARDEAREVTDFLIDLFNVSDPGEARGNEITARELLRRGADKVEVELAGQPLLRARLLRTIGIVYRKLGVYEQAESYLRLALELFRSERGERHPEVASSMQSLAVLLDSKGQSEQAEELLRQALAILVETVGEGHIEVGTVHTNLGEVLRRRGDLEAAEQHFLRALNIVESCSEPPEETARTLNNLAGVYWRQDRLDEAEPLMARVLTIEEELLGPDHPRLARTLNNLGLIRQSRGALDEAEELFRRSLAIKEHVLGEDHPDLASTVFNLGDVRLAQGDLEGAESCYLRALALDEKGSGPDHPDIAYSLAGLGAVYQRDGRLEEAAAAYRRAIKLLEAFPRHPANEQVSSGWEELQSRLAAAGR